MRRLMIAALVAILIQPDALAARTKVRDPIAEAARGLNAVIEDDRAKGSGEPRLSGFASKGCRTIMSAEKRRWVMDWTRIETVGLADTFIFVSGTDIQLAIVSDASIPDQAAKLKALTEAMLEAQKRCRK